MFERILNTWIVTISRPVLRGQTVKVKDLKGDFVKAITLAAIRTPQAMVIRTDQGNHYLVSDMESPRNLTRMQEMRTTELKRRGAPSMKMPILFSVEKPGRINCVCPTYKREGDTCRIVCDGSGAKTYKECQDGSPESGAPEPSCKILLSARPPGSNLKWYQQRMVDGSVFYVYDTPDFGTLFGFGVGRSGEVGSSLIYQGYQTFETSWVSQLVRAPTPDFGITAGWWGRVGWNEPVDLETLRQQWYDRDRDFWISGTNSSTDFYRSYRGDPSIYTGSAGYRIFSIQTNGQYIRDVPSGSYFGQYGRGFIEADSSNYPEIALAVNVPCHRIEDAINYFLSPPFAIAFYGQLSVDYILDSNFEPIPPGPPPPPPSLTPNSNRKLEICVGGDRLDPVILTSISKDEVFQGWIGADSDQRVVTLKLGRFLDREAALYAHCQIRVFNIGDDEVESTQFNHRQPVIYPVGYREWRGAVAREYWVNTELTLGSNFLFGLIEADIANGVISPCGRKETNYLMLDSYTNYDQDSQSIFKFIDFDIVVRAVGTANLPLYLQQFAYTPFLDSELEAFSIDTSESSPGQCIFTEPGIDSGAIAKIFAIAPEGYENQFQFYTQAGELLTILGSAPFKGTSL